MIKMTLDRFSGFLQRRYLGLAYVGVDFLQKSQCLVGVSHTLTHPHLLQSLLTMPQRPTLVKSFAT